MIAPAYTSPGDALPPLAISKRQAAALLNVSERTLDRLTVPHGTLPCVRLSQKVLYRTATIDAWLKQQEAAGAAGDTSNEKPRG